MYGVSVVIATCAEFPTDSAVGRGSVVLGPLRRYLRASGLAEEEADARAAAIDALVRQIRHTALVRGFLPIG